MANKETPETAPVPSTKANDDVSDSNSASSPDIPIPMEYEPVRYGNSSNMKAVMLVQNSNRDITFEQGESALENLGLRHKVLRKKEFMDNVEIYSKEFYAGVSARNLIEARKWFDKAEEALRQAHKSMWIVYRNAIKAVDAPSVSPEEYLERRIARIDRTEEGARQWLLDQEWKKIEDLKKKGCKCFNEPTPGKPRSVAEVESYRYLDGREAGHRQVSIPSNHPSEGLEGGKNGLGAGTEGSSKKKRSDTKERKRTGKTEEEEEQNEQGSSKKPKK